MYKKDEKIVEMLTAHYNHEQQAASLYTNLATIVNQQAYTNVAKFIKKLADDKIQAHLTRIYDYFTALELEMRVSTSSASHLAVIDRKPEAILKQIYDNEMEIRKSALLIADYALSIRDYETFEFIQWFIKDAVKDISEINNLIDIFKDPARSLITVELMVRNILHDSSHEH